MYFSVGFVPTSCKGVKCKMIAQSCTESNYVRTTKTENKHVKSYIYRKKFIENILKNTPLQVFMLIESHPSRGPRPQWIGGRGVNQKNRGINSLWKTLGKSNHSKLFRNIPRKSSVQKKMKRLPSICISLSNDSHSKWSPPQGMIERHLREERYQKIRKRKIEVNLKIDKKKMEKCFARA